MLQECIILAIKVYSNWFDKNHSVKVLPNQIIPQIKYSTLYAPLRNFKNPLISYKSYSTKSESGNFCFNPWFITGLTDAEGTVSVRVNQTSRLRWRVALAFQIGLHKKDIELLERVKAYFGDIGTIVSFSDMCAFSVSSPEQIFKKILPHFDKYPLISQKHIDYLLFKEIVEMMLRGEHLQKDGLQTIVNIRASLNLGLSEVLKEAFPDTIPVTRSIKSSQEIPNPEWVAGFTTGEGCFFVKITKGRNRVGIGAQIVFQVTQHIRDEELKFSYLFPMRPILYN